MTTTAAAVARLRNARGPRNRTQGPDFTDVEAHAPEMLAAPTGHHLAADPVPFRTTAPSEAQAAPMEKQASGMDLLPPSPAISGQESTIFAQCKEFDESKQKERISSLPLDPRTSSFMGLWDCATTLALIYTALVTPFEIALLEDSSIGLFVINRMVDLVFSIDVIVNVRHGP